MGRGRAGNRQSPQALPASARAISVGAPAGPRLVRGDCAGDDRCRLGIAWCRPVGSASSILFAGEVWFYLSDNGSLAASLVRWVGLERTLATAVGLAIPVIAIAALTAATFWWRVPLVPAFLAACSLALLATPASWVHYDLAIFPAALWLAAEHRERRRTIFAFTTLGFFGGPIVLTGAPWGDASTISRLVILGAMACAAGNQATSRLRGRGSF